MNDDPDTFDVMDDEDLMADPISEIDMRVRGINLSSLVVIEN